MRLLLPLLCLLLTTSPLYALPGCGAKGKKCDTCHTLTIPEADALLKNIGGKVTDVRFAPVRGLWQVTLDKDGRQWPAFVDFSKTYVLPGPTFKIAEIKPQPIQQPTAPVKVDPAKIPLENSLIMGNPKGSKKLIVFTDPDCPFCGRLHTELKKLVAMEPELAIYIKLFPLPFHPQAHGKARVILANHSLEMLEKAFNKEPLPEATDKEPAPPIDETIKLGQTLGVTGTPTMVMPDGTLVVGARDAAELATILNR
jgi:thiol:disulfide interchange protein DsbC